MTGPSPVRVRYGGRDRTFGPDRQVRIGRSPDADVPCASPYVSAAHALLRVEGASWWLIDNGSKNGIFVDGRRVGRVEVKGDVRIRLGGAEHGDELVVGPQAAAAPLGPPPVAATGGRVRIGRARDNDLVVADLLVSRHHAELVEGGGGWWLRDLASHNGTFVEGRRVAEQALADGQRVSVGQSAFRFAAGRLIAIEPDGTQVLGLAAQRLAVVLAGGEVILDDVSFELARGALLSVVGPTGSGKSTLLKALTGMRPPDRGDVAIDGCSLYDNFEELRRRLGYVPQDDILHPQLTVGRALDYGARLRFPADVSRAERHARIAEVLTELGLEHRRDVAVERLSGGQRKRTSVALELLTKPALLFLDEPTSGLDPGFEKSVMGLLRELADTGRTVVVVTHSLQSLTLCDVALFLARGGTTAYCGRPQDALGYFGRSDFADVFQDLEEQGPALAARFRSQAGAGFPMGAGGAAAPRPGGAALPPAPAPSRWASQVWTLTQRHLEIIGRDRRNFLFLAIEVLVPAVLILLLTGQGALSSAGEPGAARTLIGAVTVSVTAIGAANAVREIVKESAIYLRERAIGLRRSAYLASKMLVVGAVTLVQAVVLVLVAVSRSGGPSSWLVLHPPPLELVVTMGLGALAAVALGLLLSAVVSSSEKALALVPVIFIVQWLFSGMTLDLEDRAVLKQLSYAASANWTLAGAASSSDLLTVEDLQRRNQAATVGAETTGGAGVAPAGERGRDARWGHRRLNWAVDNGALVALTGAALAAADRALAAKEPTARTARRAARGT